MAICFHLSTRVNSGAIANFGILMQNNHNKTFIGCGNTGTSNNLDRCHAMVVNTFNICLMVRKIAVQDSSICTQTSTIGTTVNKSILLLEAGISLGHTVGDMMDVDFTLGWWLLAGLAYVIISS